MAIRKYPTGIISYFFILLLGFIRLATSSRGKQSNIWYFGYKAGGDFDQMMQLQRSYG